MENNNLYVGYGKIDITPPMGIDVCGYFKERKADGVLDNLEIVAIAVKKADKTKESDMDC